MIDILNISFEQGLICAIAIIGVIISFKLLSFPDLTVDGSFTLGGSISSVLIIHNVSPWISLLIAILAGGCAGLLTGLLHVKLKISKLLSGILMLSSLYTINLWIMGRSNVSLLDSNTLFKVSIHFPGNEYLVKIILLMAIIFIVWTMLFMFLKSEIGLFIRATGDNDKFVKSLGISTNMTTLVGLVISNGLVALSGALIAQNQGFSDINMGIGTIIWGLAGLIIGESVVKYYYNFRDRFSHKKTSMRADPIKQILAIGLIGSILYELFIAIILRLGLNPSDVKLATSIIIIIALGFGVLELNHNSNEKKIKF
jgi:putative tryptophan/tyrosine transport system permease protein